ncbi:hypothetical protein D3C72_2097470 [compost metagenome]
MAAGLKQGQDQGRELVAHGQAGEVDAAGLAGAAHGEGGAAGLLAVLANADLGGQGGDVGQQLFHLARGVAAVERGDQLDRGLKLG